MPSPHSTRLRFQQLEDRALLSASLVADSTPGLPGSDPTNLTAVGNTVFYVQTDATRGAELWKSDGTLIGTGLVKDINPGTDSSDPTNLTNVNGTLFFSAHAASGGVELWKSDGTVGGTVLVKDINPGTSGSAPYLTENSSNPTSLTNVNGTLFFAATEKTTGTELWKSDGTAAGTVLVKDIHAGTTSTAVTGLANINGTLYFSADHQLWKSDGTDAGTVLVKDLQLSAHPQFTASNGKVFFVVLGAVGDELWKTDGTAAGTVRINPASNDLAASNLVNVGGTLYFTGLGTVAGNGGIELWKSDGTNAGTVLVKDIYPGGNSSPASLINVNGSLFFTANDGVHGVELWQSDGTIAGTFLLQDINPDAAASGPGLLKYLTNVNGRLFFTDDDSFHGQELWVATPSPTPGDVTGAKITSAVFSGNAPKTLDKVRITFSEAIDPTTFTSVDIGSFVDPSGTPIGITKIALVAGTQNQFDVTFPAQITVGDYSFTTSVDISDLAGNQMNQDGDTSNGEDGEDQFTASATIGGSVPAFFAVGNVGGAVRIVNSSNGSLISTIHPFDNGGTPYTGLVQVALGDFNGDTVPDLVVSAASPSGQEGLAAGKAGKVFVFDGEALATGTVPTTPIKTFTPFATTDGPAGSSGAYINGLNIAVGDVNGDGTPDVIAGSRGGNGTVGLNEYGRLVVINGASPAGSNNLIGTIQKPFGAGYQKGVVVAAGNADGVGGDEIAVTRGGPVASPNPVVQQIKLKVLQLQGTTLTELHLSADGSTAFAPFAKMTGPSNAIKRDGRVAFLDADGDGKAELVFSVLDPLTTASNTQVRVAVYSINPTASAGAATIVSTGADSGTYVTGSAVVDHAITHVAGTGPAENLVLFTESAASGIVYLAPLTGTVQTGGFALSVAHGGITIDGI